MAAYQVLIVGAGFSGAETAFWLAQKGVRVGLLTQSLDAVMMPFLPPKPPFPPGSLLERAYDPKDERVWAFHARAKYLLEGLRPLHLFQATATGLLLEGNRVVGVRTWEGPPARGEKVVLAVGSFLGARLFLGGVVEEAGRLSEASYPDLLEDLSRLGFRFVEREGEVPETPSTPRLPGARPGLPPRGVGGKDLPPQAPGRAIRRGPMRPGGGLRPHERGGEAPCGAPSP